MHKGSTIGNIGKGVVKKIKRSIFNPFAPLGISWMDLRRLKNQPGGKLNKQKFLSGDIWFYDSAELLYGLKDIFLNEIYKVTLRKKPVIIDCGGHIGLSVLYFKKNHPDASITVFEPDEKNFDLLEKNISSQGFEDIILKQEAVWITNGTLTFSAEGSMASRISQDTNHHTTSVKSARLYDLINDPVDFLKLDIEGAEYEVLKDIRSKLHLIQNLFIEYHGNFDQQNELLNIRNWVKDSGFTFYIKEAHNVYPSPFYKASRNESSYEIQLNIFCFRERS